MTPLSPTREVVQAPVRQSDLAAFSACPLAWKLGQEHEQGWSSHPAARGQLVHRVIARLLDLMEREGEHTVPVAVALDAFEDELRGADLPLSTDGMSDQLAAVSAEETTFARRCVRWWAEWARFDPRRFGGIEDRIEATITCKSATSKDVERTITGRPDLIEIVQDEAIVWDWKASYGLPAQKPKALREAGGDDLAPDGYIQQRVYGLLVFKRYPRIERVTLRETYLPFLASSKIDPQTGDPLDPVREATLDRRSLPRLEAELAALVERFDRCREEDVYTPAPGVHCASRCPAPSRCTIDPSVRQEGGVTSPEQARDALGRMFVAQAQAARLGKDLRAWAKEHGDVPGKDGDKDVVFGPVVKAKTFKPDADAVRGALLVGEDPADLYVKKEGVEFRVHAPEDGVLSEADDMGEVLA